MADALEPARSIIARFGGQSEVAEITGASRTRVYRWTQPKENGGTDGLIPYLHAARLLQHAKASGLAVSADEFMPVTSEPAGAAA